METEKTEHSAILGKLCSPLDEEEIEYVILRRIEHLGDLGPRDDIDIVIRQKDVFKTERLVLAKLQSFGGVCFLKKSTATNCFLAIMWVNEADERQSTTLHFQIGVSHKAAILLPADILLRGRVKFGQLWRPNPAVEAVAQLFHCILTKKKFRNTDLKDIKELGGVDENRLNDLLQSKLDSKTAQLCIRKIKANEITDLLRIRHVLVKRFILPQFSRYMFENFRICLTTFWYLLIRRGALVVLIGPDGSGKTTLLANLNDRLSSTGIRVTNVYFGLTTPLIPTKWIMRKIRHRKDKDGDNKDVDMTKGITLKKEISHFLGSCHALIDIYVRYYAYARVNLSRANIVLCDRYFYDVLINPVPAPIFGFMKVFVTRLTPKPDLTFVLMDDPELIYARKPELSVGEIQRQQEIFKSLALPVVNGELLQQSPDVGNVSETALRRIMQIYASRNG